MTKNEDWKDRLSFAYSTNPDYRDMSNREEAAETPILSKQSLLVAIERKNRGGKTVTLVKGFIGKEDDLVELSKKLKTKCGVGGSVKDGEIIIQGDLKIKVAELLKNWEYKVKISG